MTDSVDEHLLTAAKLYEQVKGDLDGDERLLPHTGIVEDSQDRAALSFLETSPTNSSIAPLASRTVVKNEPGGLRSEILGVSPATPA